MTLPPDSIIPPEKLRDYLLVWQAKGDKSIWLEGAGYARAHWQTLERDIRSQLLPLPAVRIRSDGYGEFWAVDGILVGPNRERLRARSIWLNRALSAQWSFVTLYPQRRR